MGGFISDFPLIPFFFPLGPIPPPFLFYWNSIEINFRPENLYNFLPLPLVQIPLWIFWKFHKFRPEKKKKKNFLWCYQVVFDLIHFPQKSGSPEDSKPFNANSTREPLPRRFSPFTSFSSWYWSSTNLHWFCCRLNLPSQSSLFCCFSSEDIQRPC